MVEFAKKCLVFFSAFFLVYLLEYFIIVKKLKKYNKKKIPTNLNYLIIKYKIDVVKIGYKRVLKTLALCDSFIISFLFVVTDFISNIYIRMITCFILIFPLFKVTYYLIARYFRKECD